MRFSRIPKKHVCNRFLQLIRRERLWQISGSSELCGFHCRSNGRETGNDQHRKLGPACLDRSQEFETTGLGHHQIRDDQVIRFARIQGSQGIGNTGDCVDLMSLPLQNLIYALTQNDFIVHHQHVEPIGFL